MTDFAEPHNDILCRRRTTPAPPREVGYGRVVPGGAVLAPNLKYGSSANLRTWHDLAADDLCTAGPELGARGGRCNLKANRLPDRSLALAP
jgi:hypothetical protein